MKRHPRVLFAGQICGVEGYVESIATGLMAGMHAAALVRGDEPLPPPRASAFGSLTHYVTHADPKNFQPANITFDLLPALEKKIRDRKQRHQLQCELALKHFDEWLEQEHGRPNRGEGLNHQSSSQVVIANHAFPETFSLNNQPAGYVPEVPRGESDRAGLLSRLGRVQFKEAV